MKSVYDFLKEYKAKYPATIQWRLKAHAKVVEKHLNPGEEVYYAFGGQKNETSTDMFHTYVVAVTSKRIIVAQKRVLFGYFCVSITPDLFNDLTVDSGMIWGKVIIDTLNEKVVISNVDKRALPEIETAISTYIMEEKKKYQTNDKFENA